jgi:hypothetical protein
MPSSASDPESLLAHASSIRRLARALVNGGDPAADADDVEQQTWLAALRSSRRRASGEPANLRGWLRTVARNVVRRFARDHAARQRREESTAPDEALAPVDDAVAHAEMHGKVIAALVALGGKSGVLKTRVVGPRVEPLVRAAFPDPVRSTSRPMSDESSSAATYSMLFASRSNSKCG